MKDTLYNMIFKRKSFHLFRDVGNLNLSQDELIDIEETYQTLTPLCPDIRTAIKIETPDKVDRNRGNEYYILFYSEKKENYLQNIGYLGEQLDLYLASKDIGTLWFGIGKPAETIFDGLDFVIMIAISKVDDPEKFRKDMFKAKRKSCDEIWQGESMDGVTDIVRFAPSACNTQPWIVENKDNKLYIYRYKKLGKRGIMPVDKVSFYNQIDIGIFLCFLELCLDHSSISYDRELFTDEGTDAEKTMSAVYKFL